MLHASTKRLIDKLSDMTLKNRVEWNEAENGQVVHDTEGYRVTVSPAPHAVMLSTTDGKEIEICTPDDLADEVAGNGQPYTQFVASLYDEAARYARGAEKAIAALMKGLENSEKEEPQPIAADSFPSTEETSDISTLEDPGDDSLEQLPESAPTDDETKIQQAVADLADQVNTPAGEDVAPPAEEEDMAPAYAPAFIDAANEGGVYAQSAEFGELEAEVEAAPEENIAPTVTKDADTPAVEMSEYVAPTTAIPADADKASYEWQTAEPEIGASDAFALGDPAESFEPEPTLTGPISLSGISAGFGLGVPGEVIAEPAVAESSEAETSVASNGPEKLLIDGTADLPDWTGTPLAEDLQEGDPDSERASHHAPDFEGAETIAGIAPEAENPSEDTQNTDETDPSETPEGTQAPVSPFNPWN